MSEPLSTLSYVTSSLTCWPRIPRTRLESKAPLKSGIMLYRHTQMHACFSCAASERMDPRHLVCSKKATVILILRLYTLALLMYSAQRQTWSLRQSRGKSHLKPNRTSRKNAQNPDHWNSGRYSRRLRQSLRADAVHYSPLYDFRCCNGRTQRIRRVT